MQIGGRESHVSQSYSEADIGPYVILFNGVQSPFFIPELKTDSNAFTYLVTPRFKVNSDLMVYARLASGYRAGGINAGTGVPRQYKPDKTENYELGLKGDFLNHRLSVDTSIYYINWKDIQINVLDSQTQGTYFTNGSGAKSEGIELSAEAKPLTGLTLSAWIVWDDAVLTQAFPPGGQIAVNGASGDRLPYTSRFSGNLAVEQDFPLVGSVQGLVGGSVSYVSSREGVFTPSIPEQRETFPAYAKTDLRAGLKYDTWTANFFVNNVADKRGVLSGGLGAVPPFAYLLIQPRTIGLSVVKTF